VTSAADFERLPPESAVGTTKLFARQDLWEAPDPERAHSAGDFIGRLATLFGEPDPDGGFVLRHRASGLVVTATCNAVSGPCYGGVARADQQPALTEMQRLKDEWEAASVHLLTTIGTGELPSLPLLLARKDAWRRLAALSAPDGYAAAVESLESLLQETPLTDYERIDRSNELSPRRVGVREGEPFVEALPP
jgi:hypothetical protein